MSVEGRIFSACPACGGRESRVEIVACDYMLKQDAAFDDPFEVSRCGRCGLLFQNPRPRPEELARHYPDHYGPYSGSEMHVDDGVLRYLARERGYAHLKAAASLRRLFRWGPRRSSSAAETLLLPDFVSGGKLLEVGCAGGARLRLLRRLGWEHCAGIEPNPNAAARAREGGFTILQGEAEEMLETFEDGSLDAVIAGFVLEHLPDPFAFARRVAVKLKPGGQFLFSTIVVESPDFRLYGKYWYNLDLPRHHVFFRNRDLQRMLDGAFRMERRLGIAAPNDYCGSSRYRARYEPRFYDALVARAGNKLLPLCLLLARFGRCSRVAIRARRLQAG